MRELIAEIGGSSSRWALLQGAGNDAVVPFPGESMPGYNPVSGDAAVFAQGIEAYLQGRLPGALEADRISAYGAGCGTPERAARMESALRQLWPSARIEVRTDLEGAARGLWGADQGLIMVLGTGSSVGWWDGSALHQPFPSLGYVLGDEGSGADIGRALLQDAFYRRMPEALREQLFGPDGPDLREVLDAVHRSAFPSRALAAYTQKLAPLSDGPYVRELVMSRFQAFIEAFKPFHGHDQTAVVRATGSVAWGFSPILSACLLDHGMELLGVERDPLSGLVRWHRGRTG
ncbi:MAG: hypothetical protein IPM12_09610 [Flavobacteriales bacterium]|nr:hypothetical protein [Flavobacteriales bacterium]